jgi:hypothetical protein
MRQIIGLGLTLLLISQYSLINAQKTPARIKFQPKECKYYVSFPGGPVITPMDMATTTGQRVRTVRAELTIPGQNCFVRAEFTPKLPNSLDYFDDQALMDAPHNFANNDGWETPTVSIENSRLGKCVTLRGYKTISGIHVTYENRTYYGSESVLGLYGGGPSKSYPQPAVTRFFSSLGRSASPRKSETGRLEDNDYLVYQDKGYLFSASYPKSWTNVPISHPQTRFKVRSENGFDDYSVNVVPSGSTMMPREFVEAMDKMDPLQSIRPYFPDAVLVSKGKSHLSNQDAFFFVYKGIFKNAGIEIRITVMQWQTIKHGNVYTLTCRAATARSCVI